MLRPSDTDDAAIRAALYRKRFRRHKDALVVNELGLAHAKSRVDVAVINGCIHGYEIKSDRDTLSRLPRQLDIYRQTLQRLTIVTACRHAEKVFSRTPEWCGVIKAEQGPRGGISFQTIRPATKNPDTDPVMLAHLLWRDEVVELLSRFDFAPKELRRPRAQLYKMLSEVLTTSEIASSIKHVMARRRVWRDRPAHVSCGG